jgi:hypothetical protein
VESRSLRGVPFGRLQRYVSDSVEAAVAEPARRVKASPGAEAAVL